MFYVKNALFVSAFILIISCKKDDNTPNSSIPIIQESELIQWYIDNDIDGFGDPDITLGKKAAAKPDGFVSDNTDCDDSDENSYPGSIEDDYDGIDSNCDDKQEVVISTFSKTFGTPSENDFSKFLIKTNDEGYLAAGMRELTNIENFRGSNTVLLVKYDAEGNEEWDKLYGGPGYDYIANIIKTSDGGYLMSGSSTSEEGDIIMNAGKSDWWIFKLDFSGNIVWKRTFGGSVQETATSVLETKDGNYLVSGNSWSSDGDFERADSNSGTWFFMLNNTGDLLWKTYQNGGTPSNVVQMEDETFFAVGNIFTTGTTTELRTWKLNKEGVILATNTINVGYSQVTPEDILITSDQNILVVGSVSIDASNSDAMLLNITQNGAINWIKIYGNDARDVISSVVISNDNNSYLVTGLIPLRRSTQTDVWIAKYDLNGIQIWENRVGGSYYDTAQDLIVADDGSLRVLGHTLSADGPITDREDENDTTADLWFFKLKPNGKF